MGSRQIWNLTKPDTIRFWPKRQNASTGVHTYENEQQKRDKTDTNAGTKNNAQFQKRQKTAPLRWTSDQKMPIFDRRNESR